MDIQTKSRLDIAVTQYFTKTFNVKALFYGFRGESVARCMEIGILYASTH